MSEWVSEWWWWWWLVGWVGLGWVGWVGGMHEILTPPTLNFLCAYQSNQSQICQVHLLKDWMLPWFPTFYSAHAHRGPTKITKFCQTWIWVQELSSSPLINLSGGGEWVSEWWWWWWWWLVGLGWVGWVGGLHQILTPPTLQFICAYQPHQSFLLFPTPLQG